MDYLLIFVRCLVGGTFAVAALLKLADRGGLADMIRALRIVPRHRVPALAYATIGAELGTATLCAVNPAAPLGLGLGAVLLVVFAAAAARAQRIRVTISCRCFGRRGAPLGRRQIVRNSAIAALSLAALVTTLLRGGGHPPLTGWVVVLSVAAAVTTLLLVVFLDEIVELILPSTQQEA
ncbi:MAG: MauE/DoxX family redox-associated membrane protein [Actinocatenispora sp.]